jgi:hypothetical protein
MMTAFLTLGLLLVLAVLLVRWFAAIPLVRTLTVAIDSWADSVQGSEAGPLR